jgi:hypothetical protein
LLSQALHRARDKSVALLEDSQLVWEGDEDLATATQDQCRSSAEYPFVDASLLSAPDELSPLPVPLPEIDAGRISIHCTANGYDVEGLQAHLLMLGFRSDVYPGGVLHSRYLRRDGRVGGDVYAFRFGAVVFWDLTPLQERRLLAGPLKRFEEQPLAATFVESETFKLKYVPFSKPSIAVSVASNKGFFI